MMVRLFRQPSVKMFLNFEFTCWVKFIPIKNPCKIHNHKSFVWGNNNML